MLNTKDKPIEIRRFYISLTIPSLFILLFWLTKTLEIVLHTSFYKFGIFPRELSGILGILFTPFLHGDLKHLIGNSISFFVLSVSLFYFYPQIALKVFLMIYLISHTLLWIGGRESWHIGASVLVYGFAAFLFVSGIIRNYTPLLAISMLVILLYGSMIWHLFPFTINDPISWEGHLFGAITGAYLGFFYRKDGPTRPLWSWEIEPETDDDLNFTMNEETIEENEIEHNNQNSTFHSGFTTDYDKTSEN